MATKKAKAIQEHTTGYSAKFVGRYVNDVRLMTEAALITGLHGLMIGAPGYGKTQIVMDVFRNVIPDQYVFQRLDPSTPPSALKPKRQLVLVEGKEALIDNPQGTMYQPGMRGGIMDEMGRANSASFDAMLDLFDREDIDFGDQVIVGTANFMPTSERQAALIDRIALWQWVSPDAIQPDKIVEAQLLNLNSDRKAGGDCLTLEKVDWVKSLKPSTKAAKACADFVNMIAGEARKADFEVNPRRLFQWGMAAFKFSAYTYGTEDFESVAPEAAYIFRWLMPCLTKNDYDKWQNVAKAFADVIGTACEEVIKSLEAEVKKIDRSDLSSGMATLAIKFGNAKKSLEDRFPAGDKRITETIKKIDLLFNDAVLGKK